MLVNESDVKMKREARFYLELRYTRWTRSASSVTIAIRELEQRRRRLPRFTLSRTLSLSPSRDRYFKILRNDNSSSLAIDRDPRREKEPINTFVFMMLRELIGLVVFVVFATDEYDEDPPAFILGGTRPSRKPSRRGRQGERGGGRDERRRRRQRRRHGGTAGPPKRG